jgi:type I protein arginine methyltransferase
MNAHSSGRTYLHEIATRAGRVSVLVDPDSPGPDSPSLGPSIGEHPIFDGAIYAVMTNDSARNERFQRALSALCPGRRVLDVGTGVDLNWAREAIRYGALQVDAVEVIEQSYLAAGRLLAELPERDRITLHLGSSTELALPERAEVCVGEIIGSVAGAEGAAAVMLDVRTRLLTVDGVLVPHRAATLAAGATLAGVLGGRPIAFSVDWLPYLLAIFAADGPGDVRLRVRNPVPDALVTDAVEVEVLDFNGDLQTEQERHVVLTVRRAGFLDGILAWLQLWCSPDEQPLDALATRTNWASVYFPLFDEEIPVSPGDQLTLQFTTRLSEDGIHPGYFLSATLRANGRAYTGSHASPHHNPGFGSSAIYRRLFPSVKPGDVRQQPGPC